MSCADAIVTIRGDDLVLAFVATNRVGDIVDLTGFDVVARILWRGITRMEFDLANGITIANVYPPLADDPEDQEPHGYLSLEESDTAQLPVGRLAEVIFTFAADGETTSTEPPLLLDVKAGAPDI